MPHIVTDGYGGGFTIPAYLKDLFGSYQVGASHGRLITAWSMAAVIGPLLINGLFERRVSAGLPTPKGPSLQRRLRYIMVGLLLLGLVANLLVQARGCQASSETRGRAA